MKKWLVRALPLFAASAAMAEGYTVPAAVTGAVTDLESAATGLAGAALPAVVQIGLPFIGIAVIYLLFRVFRKFAGGR